MVHMASEGAHQIGSALPDVVAMPLEQNMQKFVSGCSPEPLHVAEGSPPWMVHMASEGAQQIGVALPDAVALPLEQDMQKFASGFSPEPLRAAEGSPQLVPSYDHVAYAVMYMPAVPVCVFSPEGACFAGSPANEAAYTTDGSPCQAWNQGLPDGRQQQQHWSCASHVMAWDSPPCEMPASCGGSGPNAFVPLKQISAGLKAVGEARAASLAYLSEPGVVRRLSFERAGCRVVQDAFDVADRRTATMLANDLRGCVVSAMKCPHGNYVVQKIIKTLAVREVPFVVEEIAAEGKALVWHEYGCRIFCRLIELAARDESVVELLDGILSETDSLAQDTFGHHIVERVLEYGVPRQQRCVSQALRGGSLVRNAGNPSAVHVLEKALEHGDKKDREALAGKLRQLPAKTLGWRLGKKVRGGRLVKAAAAA